MRKRVIPVLLALFCAVMTLTLPVTAADDRGYSVTLHYYIKDQKRSMSDVTFYLYKVGENGTKSGNSTYNFEATEDFKDAQVDLTGLDFWMGADDLFGRAYALALYSKDSGVKPDRTAKTDSHGDLTFWGLEPGLYLVWGETTKIIEPDGRGGSRELNYTPQASLIPLPYPTRDGSVNNEVDVDVKYDQFPPPGSGWIEITVKKVWKPEGRSHPDSITVVLLRDNKPTHDGEVTLNADNDWTYTWDGLDSNFYWEVIEKDVPDGYTVSVDRNVYFFTITNTITDPPPSEDDPTPDDPTPTPSDDPAPDDPTPTPSDVLNNPSILSDIPDDTDRRRLPQTGQLWWPVPVLVAVGMVFLLIGAVLSVRKEEAEELKKPYE